MRIEPMDARQVDAHAEALTDLLIEAVAHGALVGHLHDLDRERASRYWRGVKDGITDGERVLFVASEADQLIGTVQLYLAPASARRSSCCS